MDFEFDARKGAANKTKHGIDFKEAQALWENDARLEMPLRTTDEPRFLVISRIGSVFWSAIITYRGETIRLISVRRSRKEEREFYETL